MLIAAVTSQGLGEPGVHCLSVLLNLHVAPCKRVIPISQTHRYLTGSVPV